MPCSPSEFLTTHSLLRPWHSVPDHFTSPKLFLFSVFVFQKLPMDFHLPSKAKIPTLFLLWHKINGLFPTHYFWSSLNPWLLVTTLPGSGFLRPFWFFLLQLPLHSQDTAPSHPLLVPCPLPRFLLMFWFLPAYLTSTLPFPITGSTFPAGLACQHLKSKLEEFLSY